MDLEIKNILEKIEENGYEAYIVGGFVRDYLLGIDSVDIDICTNALPKDIISIFNIKKETVSYGSITIKSDKFNFDITTYRKESDYCNRRPQRIEYTNNLITDILRRDITINSICMNKEGKIFDYLNGQEDLNKKLIRVIGDTNAKLTEDPLRILRSIRFAITLNFNLDKPIVNFIKNNKNIIKTISYTRKKEELDKILSSKNAIIGLKMLKDLNLLEVLDINYDKIIEVPDLLGYWAQIDFSNKYPFNKSNINIINRIRYLLNKKEITNYDLYKEGLYICQVAGDILGLNKKDINERYLNLKIKNQKDLVINSSDIINILNIKPSSQIKIIFDNILKMVLEDKLENNFDTIKEYIIDNWK